MEILPVVVDTTFILPLFGVEIDLSPNFIRQIKVFWTGGVPNIRIFIPSTTLIEVMYKINAQYRIEQNAALFECITDALPTLIQIPYVKIFFVEANVIATEMAIKIRTAGHPDLMDCYNASAAFVLDGIYLTEEKTIQKVLKKIPEYPIQKIWNWHRFSNEFFRNSL